MVPGTFTQTELARARKFIIDRVKKTTYKQGVVRGNPFVTYCDLMAHLNYTIDSEGDGDRAGIPAGESSKIEIAIGGPLIGALVVNKKDFKPGHGFWVLAIELGLFLDKQIDRDGRLELEFWNKHVQESVKKYGQVL